MNGCVYRTEDNKCKFWSDYGKGIVSYCDPCDCEEKTMSNADRIRGMSDEELAQFITDDWCEILCGSPSVCDGQCEGKMLSWLKAPVDGGET